MDIIYTEELEEGISLEVDGFLIIGTKSATV